MSNPFHRRVAELWVHGRVLVGLALDRELQRLRRRHLILGVKQVQVAEGVQHFLISRVLEVPGCFLITHVAAELGEIAVLDVGHRLAREGGFEVLDGGRLGVVEGVAHGDSSGWQRWFCCDGFTVGIGVAFVN